MDKDLHSALAACKKAAEAGFVIAKQNNAEIEANAQLFGQELTSLEDKIKVKEAKIPEYLEQFLTSCKNYHSELCRLHKDVAEDLQNKQSNLSLFNVVVFGRTMAGKSTLMETLTRGQGASIGKGAQRTTLDVRGYCWNGMQIYDTPGIAAAATAGREDEEKAYHAAKYADMMVFLFADDAPKQPDAAAFVELKKMGKSIIVLINVKQAIPEGKISKLTLRDLQRKMEPSRLDAMRETFLQMVSQQGRQEHEHIQFIYANLHAAFLSQQADYKEYAEVLRQISNIELVEDAVVNEIKRKGSFFQYKNYVDCTYKEIWEVVQRLQEQARGCTIVLKDLNDALQRLENLRNSFKKQAENRINEFVQNVDGTLRNNAESFAREYYDYKNAGEYWEEAVKSLHIDQLAGDILVELGDYCQDILEEFAKEFNNRLAITQRLQCEGIEGVKIVDVRGITNFAMAGLALAGLILGGPIGIALGVISFVGSILSSFFTSREEKIRKAINKLRNALMDNITSIVNNLKKQMQKAFNEKVMDGYFDKVVGQYREMRDNLVKFHDLELNIASKLTQNLLVMNKQVLDAACDHLHLDELKRRSLKMARIPGRVVLICVSGNETDNPHLIRGLADLIQEEVLITKTGNAQDMITGFLNVDNGCITANNSEFTITNPGDDVYRRVQRYGNLVEQLTGCTLILAGKAPEWQAPDMPESQPQPGGQQMGGGKEPPKKQVLEGYDPDADLENVLIQWDIAKHYANGDLPSLGKSWREAAKWAEKSARQGHGKAASLVGDYFYFGLDTDKDYNEAMIWYELALENGYYRAGKYLGDCHYFGLGVEQSYAQAFKYYEIAALHNVAEAQSCLGNLYRLGHGCEQNNSEAAKWYERGAEGGNDCAQNNLGSCFYNGEGKDPSYSYAEAWYRLADAKGNKEAHTNLVKLFR